MNTRHWAAAIAATGLLAAYAAHGETLSHCGTKTNYQLSAPAGDVAPGLKAFSGIWVGSWASGQLCSALIVESVQSDGSVRARYVWGTNPDWRIREPGSQSRTGKISNGTLLLPGGGGNPKIEFRMVNAGELDATFTTASATRGSFKRGP